ncbi:EAL domain-containing protein [Aurantimonas sp. VKM B-3413]|uniref:EAL domain-containing response regulator n=1 Tax=Aurantimonas sp. VKM B-3413 TaxID=2779401 RepID=UPI001E589C81|nr:EAL domain-containing response regulator [Aurantimonas sp. VKM B-3413]MCB8839672.1 EAL domain-containing response regulator [Aurantimonas sp. VKM B-3413]
MATTHHFLIVDDDPVFSAVAESVVLSSGDHTTSLAASGEDGLRQLSAATSPVDIIILDLNMPRLDGLAYLRVLSEVGYRGAVIISSGESQAIIEAAQRMGRMLGVKVCGTLKKPLQRDAFLAEIAKCETATMRAKPEPVSGRVTGDLVPYYQPQIDTRDGRVVGLEALIRLQTPDGRLLGPDAVFHPEVAAAELSSLTLSIADLTMRDSATWKARGFSRRVSINLDARILDEGGFPSRLVDLGRRHGLEPSSVVCELTETALPKSMTSLIETLTRLRMAGFGLSLDDYGTGTANYGMLRLCPFSELKIDKTIVQSAGSDRVARLFMSNAAAMARDLDLEVVAEGVETEDQLSLVREAGISIVQGFLFSRPIPADAAFQTYRYEHDGDNRVPERSRARG